MHDVEWSGTLFYKCKGSLDDGTFEVTCVDLYVMDIGSSAYTEFKESADIISYRIDNDLLDEDIYEGLIHSHNSMPTFFSSTDCNTLIEEGTNMHHFVSLIVNNEGTYTAAVTRRVVTESKFDAHIKVTQTRFYDTYNDERVILERDKVKEEDKEKVSQTALIEYFDLEIDKESTPYPFLDLDSRISEIKKNKAKPYSSFTTPVYNKGTSYNKGGYTPTNKGTVGYQNYPYDLYDDDDDYDVWPYDRYPAKTEPSKQKKSKSTGTLTEVPLCLQETFDPELVKSLSLQLLTGSVIINPDAVDPEEWVKKMDSIYEKRFGPLDKLVHFEKDKNILLDNNARLESWIEGMVEFLVYTRDEDLLSRLNLLAKDVNGLTYDESDTAEVCAYSMYLYLDALSDSYVKDIMLQTLATYIPDGIENFV